MLPESFKWLDMSVDQAQALSQIALGLFVVTFICIILGVFLKLGPKALHWVVTTAFSACILMGAITSMLYFWHHFLRK